MKIVTVKKNHCRLLPRFHNEMNTMKTNRYIPVLIIILFLSSFLSAQTDIRKSVINGEIWSKEKSPYYIYTDLEIVDLLILPGVTVLFTDDFAFDVTGRLTANGFYSDSIHFAPDADNLDGWQGIRFMSGISNSELSYCKIEGALNYGIAAISIDQDSLQIRNCDIVNNKGDGIYLFNSRLIEEFPVLNCNIKNNTGNGVSLNASVASFQNVIISDNNLSGVYSPDSVSSLIDLYNVVVADNGQTGVNVTNGILTIESSIIYYNNPDLSPANGFRSITYSDIGGDEVTPGTGNLNLEPEFADHKHFMLSEQSPCIDRGKNNEDTFFPPSLGSSMTDMGAYGGKGAGLWYPALYIIPDTLDFGVTTLDSSRALTFTVHNYREETIGVSNISFEGENADVFFTSSGGFTLDARDSKEITVQFQPVEQLVYNAECVLETDGLPMTEDYGTFSNHLKGRGAIPKINISDSLLNFNSVFLGDTARMALIVSNSGDDTLRINGIITGSPVFLPEDSCLKVIPEIGIDTIEVAFTPSWLENYTDTLIVKSNDPQKPQLKITLSGQGIGSILELEHDTLDFDVVRLGSDSLLNLIIINSGNRELEIQKLDIHSLVHEQSAFAFYDENIILPIHIEPAGRDTLSIVFRPDSAGTDSALLAISSNDSFHPIRKVLLEGNGTGPVLFTSSNEIDFEMVPVFTDSQQIVTLRNSGNEPLNIDSLTLDHPDHSPGPFKYVCTGWTLPLNLPPDSSKEVIIRYQPRRANTDSARFVIISDDPINPLKEIKLSGHALAPQIVWEPGSVDFGRVADNVNASASVRIYNNGEGTLLIYADSLSIQGPDASVFTLDEPPSDIYIAPQDSVDISMHVFSDQPGPKNAVLHVPNNDPAKRRIVDIPLTVLIFESEIADIGYDAGNSTKQFIKGKDGILSFSIKSKSEVDSADLFIRLSGKSSYGRIPLIRQDSTDYWSAQIEAAWVTERGFECYLQANYGWTSTVWPEQGPKQPKSVQVAIPSLAFPQKTKKEIYQKISLPVHTYGQTLNDLFADELGSYDVKKYRFFDCTDGQNYTEISDLNIELPPGKALWLITKEAVTLNIKNGISPSTEEPYRLSLKQGWNMIGTPYAFTVNWKDIDAVHPLRYYDGSDWLFVAVLEPYKGYAVYVEKDTTIEFIAKEGTSSRAVPKLDAAAEGEEWHIRLSVKADSLKDMYNFAGVHPRAKAGMDRYDYPEPPPIGSFAALYFVDDQQKRFSTNYREPGQEGYVFPFEVLNNTKKEMEIFITPSELPADFGWLVLSPDNGIKYSGEVIRCNNTGGRYQLVVGTEDFLNDVSASYKTLPDKFELRQNYPNPFNPVTIFAFQLPGAQKVSLTIYNILGQRIKTLVSNRVLQAGYYSFRWDGHNDYGQKAAAGIYFLQFRSENYRKTIKMIMQK